MDEVLFEGESDAPELVCLIHGWPDDLHLWDDLVPELLKTGQHRCLRVTLPGFGHHHGKTVNDGKQVPVSAPNFHENAQLVAEVIQAHRRGGEQVTLVVHDWGSVTGIQLQRQFPQLVKRMVIMDIGPTDSLGFGAVFFMGAYYQWFNQAAYLTWRYVPLIGESVGNWMHRTSISRFKSELWNRGPQDQSASAAYYYHHFQKDYWLHFLGRGKQLFQPRQGVPDPSCPTLFLYGTKGLGGGFKQWMDQLKARPDCDVKAIPGDHWFMLKSPQETSDAVIEWLSIEGGGKLQQKANM